MLIVTASGNLGRDAEFKTTQNGKEFCSFSVAASIGYGENKQTVWLDVSKWGAGAEGLARILRKGSNVTVSGEMSLREHNGKTYVQCRADHVSINSTPKGEGGAPLERATRDAFPDADDLGGDEIPFATNVSVW